MAKLQRVICVKDWSSINPRVVEGAVYIVEDEFFENGEGQYCLREEGSSALSEVFYAPSIFFEDEGGW